MSVNLTSLVLGGPSSYSATNRSPPKVTYSFPKSKRFAESYKAKFINLFLIILKISCDAMYDMPK